MAKVYLAEQEVLEREVALKVMSKSLADDPSFGHRFFSEARIVSQLVHPNIVTVHDMGVHEGAYYISMEYIGGLDLKNAQSSLSIAKSVSAVRDIAKALIYASEKGVVHRDIKPENIMFHASDGRAVLTDFGIAKAVESDVSVTQTGMAIGTPHYMSPEQAKGKAVDTRSDIYSLGVVFYFLITGRVPYDGDSAVTIGIKHISDPLPQLPMGYESLQGILDLMLAKDRENRYQKAEQLIEDLDSIDMALLEHTIGISQYSDQAGDTLENGIPTEIHDFESGQSPYVAKEQGDENVSGLFETEDHVFGKRRSFLGWVFLLIFVTLGGAGGIYYTQPDFAKPWIAQADPYISQAVSELKGFLESYGLDLKLNFDTQ